MVIYLKVLPVLVMFKDKDISTAFPGIWILLKILCDEQQPVISSKGSSCRECSIENIYRVCEGLSSFRGN